MGNPNMPGISERDLMGCEIRAVLPGFRSEPVSLAGRRMFDNPDVGTIILHRWATSRALPSAPPACRRPRRQEGVRQGCDLLRKKKTGS